MKAKIYPILMCLILQPSINLMADEVDINLAPCPVDRTINASPMNASMNSIEDFFCFKLDSNYLKELDITDHDTEKCDQLKSLASCKKLKLNSNELTKANTKIIEEIPSAILLSELKADLSEKAFIHNGIKDFEEESKVKVCPEENIQTSCSNDIKKILPDLFLQPSLKFLNTLIIEKEVSNESDIDAYSKNFTKKTLSPKDEEFKNELSKCHGDNISSCKMKLQSFCEKVISYNDVCKKRDDRLLSFNSCIKSAKKKNCLKDFQAEANLYFAKYKSNENDFLVLENQLCADKFIVKNEVEQQSLASVGSINNINSGAASAPAKPETGTRDELESRHREQAGIISVAARSAGNPNSPDFVGPPAPDKAVARSADTTSLGDSYVAPDTKTNGSASVSNNDFASRNSTVASDFASSMNTGNSFNQAPSNNFVGPQLPPDFMSKELAQLNNGAKLNPSAGALSSEAEKAMQIDSLTSQIGKLQSKLDDMSKSLSAKPKINSEATGDKEEVAVEEDEELTKEQLAQKLKTQKEIEQVKKELLALKEEKEKLAQLNEAKKAAKVKAQDEAFTRSFTTGSSRDSDARELREENKRIMAANNNYYEQSSGNLGNRASANSGFTNNKGVGFNLTSTKLSAVSSENAAIVISTSELSSYQYRLPQSASEVEISKLLEKANGKFIILGDNEKIVPELDEFGKVKLDADGKVIIKKRIKLTIADTVKSNGTKRTPASAPVDSSRHKEVRELTRYEQMKKALKDGK